MNTAMQARKADELRKLHNGTRTLVLPNAWDVASARVLEELGYPAIATTSAGIAFALHRFEFVELRPLGGYAHAWQLVREVDLVAVPAELPGGDHPHHQQQPGRYQQHRPVVAVERKIDHEPEAEHRDRKQRQPRSDADLRNQGYYPLADHAFT